MDKDGPPLSGSLRDYCWEKRYSTSRNNLYEDFYAPAILRSSTYDRAVGFFRSSVFGVTGPAVARFALSGGKMRLVCSPELTRDDAEAIASGVDARDVASAAILREIERLSKQGWPLNKLELLSNLIASSALDIRLLIWPEGSGLFHDKIGCFGDERGDRLTFVGSLNETWDAWGPHGNHESFDVFGSWEDDDRVSLHATYFESLWNGREDKLRSCEPSQALREGLVRFASPSPISHLESAARKKYHRPRQLFDFQLDAIENWKKAGMRGILQHATGTGKTLTAIAAIRYWLEHGGPALVLVPSLILQAQWSDEIAAELSDIDPAVLTASSTDGRWKQRGLLSAFTKAGEDPRIVIATMQTACTRGFRERIKGGEHLLVVADEVHRLGAATAREAMKIMSSGRLGLSATPARYRDRGGTNVLLEYFEQILEPVITLRDAIDLGRLCPYEYHPHFIALDSEETEQWLELTKKMRRLAAILRESPNPYLQEQLDLLSIARARISKKAVEKRPLVADIVQDHFRRGQSWLVYCEDTDQLRSVRDELACRGFPSLEYHSAMESNRAATLERFRRDGGILVSIRCLDEGIDIPSITHAIIVASSRNPREFIQRRGRVLRRYVDKQRAVVHDVLVEPPADLWSDLAFESLELAEMARATLFAKDAINPGAYTLLLAHYRDRGIDLDSVAAGDEAEDLDEE